MAKHVEHEVAYYYDFHPTEEDLMGKRLSMLRSLNTWLRCSDGSCASRSARSTRTSISIKRPTQKNIRSPQILR